MNEHLSLMAGLPARPFSLAELGQQANRVATDQVFAAYHRRLAANSRRRKRFDLGTFAWYLQEAETGRGFDRVPPEAHARVELLMTQPAAWEGLTWGLVAGFLPWQLGKGLSISSINARLSSLHVYAELACQAGVLSHEELVRIQAIGAISSKEGHHLDDERKLQATPTRKGKKKATPCLLSGEDALRLKREQDATTTEGRRAALLMCLLVDQGLRCDEVRCLEVSQFNLRQGLVTFYRPKVHLEQTHRLSPDTLEAARRYFAQDQPHGFVFPGRRIQCQAPRPISARAIEYWVCALGRALDPLKYPNVSPHDLRHYWTDAMAEGQTDLLDMVQAGGWSSVAMVSRYRRKRAIANERVVLGVVPAAPAEPAGADPHQPENT